MAKRYSVRGLARSYSNYQEDIIVVKTAVIGLGYIGLPTALSLAVNGVQGVGVDINPEVVAKLNSGKLTFEEKGLSELFKRACDSGVEFVTEYPVADVYICAVPTPYDKNSKKVDPSYVIDSINRIISVAPRGSIIVIESTISPGTVDRSIRPIFERNGLVLGSDFHIAHAPERIIPGNMLYELENNSRIVGADSVEVAEKVRDIYSSFCKGDIVLTDIRTAEMTKVVENTFRDINIAYANELAKICSSDGMDVYKIIEIANMHPRVNIHTPGPGVGGHCISVDSWFLVGDYPGLANIILAARKINDSMPEFVLERAYNIMKEQGIKDVKRVGLYGLTYKENVDDTRDSPTLQLLDCMARHLAGGLKVYDPYINEKIVDNQILDFNEFLDSVDMVIIMVGHNHLKENMARIEEKVIFDTRNACPFEHAYKL